ncbi:MULTISPECIES: glucose 1-dehydrogenase [unclassified Pseudomonas]|uniref:glucose 1-dehydrogenase n=1 Tax=unclassified Pseudomonas TaxID=196821 RepID=UPI00244BC5DD|nr:MULTISPECIES: glucose 1-dehydrogenase [unclassified Pseudomonas]MDH0893249.1 glucose 1-dehydrogenase [Pseudomonas sp. GD03875]MDH1064245.1 glucose 1-dehydrogenase [Pseudomonas sp. GD03985]
MKRLNNRVCLVTGAASGIGLAIAETFLAEGATVLLTDIDADNGESQAERLRQQGFNALFQQHDVTDETHWQRVMETVRERWARLDVLVNNAGIAILADVESLTLEQWRRTNAINLDAVFIGTQQAIAAMKERGGSIINVASIEGIIGEPLVPSYNASKGGVRIFTRSAAAHCARRGYPVRINNLCPGYVMTRMISGGLEQAGGDLAQQFQGYLQQRIPMGRLGSVEEIAKAALFLAADDSSYMTGSDLVVDGGYLAQ